ncbi:unnamed protein product [Leptosia nina]|uniref:ZAD domain-containing protein n=1 Tax=Leptosia nina TaxID=320188 RepID=A0AAV1JBC0_9NEOP
MMDKILTCLNVFIEKSDDLTAICHRCAVNVERFYDFAMIVKKSQNDYLRQRQSSRQHNDSLVSKHQISSFREQANEADYSFSFLFQNEDAKKSLQSSPLFSYCTPQNVLFKNSNGLGANTSRAQVKTKTEYRRTNRLKKWGTPKKISGDIFESQSDLDEAEFKRPEWKLTPSDCIKQIKEKCFGRSGI